MKILVALFGIWQATGEGAARLQSLDPYPALSEANLDDVVDPLRRKFQALAGMQGDRALQSRMHEGIEITDMR